MWIQKIADLWKSWSADLETIYVVSFLVLVGCVVLAVVFGANGKAVRAMQKTNQYVQKCMRRKRTADAARVRFPKEMQQGWRNYRNSVNRYPSEFLGLTPRGSKNAVLAVGGVLTLLCGGLVTCRLAEGGSYETALPLFGLAMATLAAQCLLSVIGKVRNSYVKRTYEVYCRSVDYVFGPSKQNETPDVCLDAEVDAAVQEIEALKAEEPNAANKVAAILNGLHKQRTVEQQRKLNVAMNGLLQVLAARAEEQRKGTTTTA